MRDMDRAPLEKHLAQGVCRKGSWRVTLAGSFSYAVSGPGSARPTASSRPLRNLSLLEELLESSDDSRNIESDADHRAKWFLLDSSEYSHKAEPSALLQCKDALPRALSVIRCLALGRC
jgi:hypothetical protein